MNSGVVRLDQIMSQGTSMACSFVLHVPNIIKLKLYYNWLAQAVDNISKYVLWNSSKPLKFALKLTNQSTLNKAHVMEITKELTIAFMKSGNSLAVWCRVRKKTENGENLFFKALANRFWLTSKSCSWFNKVVHGQSSIK